jgi:BirA family biotin operon repressor/biotin-[acetyl-CoA-carboxylase] ligase
VPLFPHVNFNLAIVEECESTQKILLERRGDPNFHGAAVLALRQTNGYGRRGREWDSLSGNLALSFGLEIARDESLALLPFACGIALHAAAAARVPSGVRLRLKWPNDLYLEERKLAGLIAQGRQIPGRGSEVVLGVGVNLSSAPEGLESAAVALGAYGDTPSPADFAVDFLTRLEGVFYRAKDFAGLRAEWESAARLHEGELYVVGEIEPVKAHALLITGELELEGGRRLASEEVSLRYARPSLPN